MFARTNVHALLALATLVASLFAFGAPSVEAGAPERITIGGLFPMIWAEEAECAGHLLAAADRINNKTDGYLDNLLPETHVEIYVNDSKCAPKPAVESALWQLTQPVPTQAILGAGCSGASMQSQLVLQVFEVPQVCYGATNPALGNKAVYPYFLRTIPSDSLQGMALASVASILNYTRIAILANTDAYGSGVAGAFLDACAEFDIDVPLYLTFEPVESSTDLDAELDGKLQQIKEAGIRVIMLGGQRNDAKAVFKKAYEQGMTGEDYLWLGVDAWMANPIYDDIEDPTERALLATATQGSLGLLPDIKGELLEQYVQDVWNDKYCERYAGTEMADEDGDCSTVSIICPTAIDAATALLLAFDEVVSGGGSPDDGPAVLEALKGVSFDGVSGAVLFDERGERMGSAYVIRSYHKAPEGGDGGIRGVAKIQGGAREVNAADADWLNGVVWPGNRAHPPADGNCPKNPKTNLTCSGFGTCTYGPGICLCFDGYEGADCGTVAPKPLYNLDKKSAAVACSVDNLYTYTPQSFPANVSFDLTVASDPLTDAPAAVLGVTTLRGLQPWASLVAATPDEISTHFTLQVSEEADLVPLTVYIHATQMVCPASFSLIVTDSGAISTDCQAGTFRNSAGNCEDCPAGSFTNKAEMKVCKPCPGGTFAPTAGSPGCTVCGKGEFSNRTGSTQPCEQCSIGHFQSKEGQVACEKCPAGSFQDEAGMAGCRRCSFAEYQDEEGTAACKSCPVNTDNFQAAVLLAKGVASLESFVPDRVSDCLPKVGYYGWPGLEATECPNGGICCECKEPYSAALMEKLQEDWTSYCNCLSGTIYPFPAPNYVRSVADFSTILPCPVGGACLGSTHLVDTSHAQQNLTCHANNNTCLSYGQCSAAYRDRLCGDCEEGFYQLNNLCEACPSSNVLQALYMFVLVILLLLAMIYAITQGMRWFKCGAVAVLFDFVQLQGTYLGFDLGWPPAIRKGLSLSTALNFNMDYLSPACLVERDFYSAWTLEMLVPVIMLLGFCMVYAMLVTAYWLSPKYDERKAHVYCSYGVNAICFATMVGYVYMVGKTLELFHCKTFEDGSNYLVSYPALECYDDTWWNYFPIGLVGLVVYCLGIPVGLALFLHLNRTNLGSPAFKRRFGALYLVYKEDMYLWEVFLKVKKLLVMLAGRVFFSNHLEAQTTFALLVLVGSMVLSRYQPFRYARNNMLQFYASVVSFLTLFWGVFFYTGELDEGTTNALVALCMVGWGAALLILTHGIIFEYVGYFVRNFCENRPWLTRLMDSPTLNYFFATRAAMNPYSHWAWRDILLDEVYWLSKENPSIAQDLLTNNELTESSLMASLSNTPTSPARCSPGNSGRFSDRSPKRLSIREVTRSSSFSLMSDVLADSSLAQALQTKGFDGFDDARMRKFHQFICAGDSHVDEAVFDDWRDVMRNTDMPKQLDNCVRSVLEYKRLKVIAEQLREVRSRRGEACSSGAARAPEVCDLENPPELQYKPKPKYAFGEDTAADDDGKKKPCDDDQVVVPKPHDTWDAEDSTSR